MKYTFKIGDISTTRIFKPDISNLQFNKSRNGDDQYGRLEMSGTLKFVGEDAKLIFNFIDDYGHNELSLQVYQNSTYLGNGLFNTQQIENRELNQYTFKVIVQDEYMELINKGDIQYNILEVPYTSRSLQLQLTGFLEEATKAIFNYSIDVTGPIIVLDYVGAYYTFDIDDSYVNWTCLINNYTPIQYIVTPPTEFNIIKISGVAVFLSQKAYGSYAGTVAQPPSGSGWAYIRDDVYNNYKFPLYRRPIQSSDVWQNITTNYYGIELRNARNTNFITVPSTDITYINVTRQVEDCIEYIVNEIDPSINFDSSGTITDSFYSFKTKTGDVQDVTTPYPKNLPFNDFLIVQLTDLIPDPDTGLQKSNLATLGELSFNDFLNWMKTYGFFWFLENRSGSYYFRCLHKDDIVLLNNNPNLINWFGKNYLRDYKNFEYEPPEYTRLINKQAGKDLELLGTDVIFYTYPEGKNRDISSDIFFIDLNDIVANGENEYDTSASDKFVLISAYIDSSNYYIPRLTDSLIVPNVKVMNGDLGWPKVASTLFPNMPDSKATINNINTIVPNTRVAKRKKYELTIPINGIYDFELSSYLVVENENDEIESFNQNADQNIGKLNIRK